MPPKVKKKKATPKRRLKPKPPKKAEVVETKLARVGRRYVQYQLEKVTCGKPGCSKLHGPYWWAYWNHHSRRCKRYIGKRFRPMTLDMFRTVEKRKKQEAAAKERKLPKKRSLRRALKRHQKHVSDVISDGKRRQREAIAKVRELAERAGVDERQLSLLDAAAAGKTFEIPAHGMAVIKVTVTESGELGAVDATTYDATVLPAELTGWEVIGGTQFEVAARCIDCGVRITTPKPPMGAPLEFIGCMECGRPPANEAEAAAQAAIEARLNAVRPLTLADGGDENAAAETPASSDAAAPETPAPEAPTDPAPPPQPPDDAGDADEATRASSRAATDESSAEVADAPRASAPYEHAPT